MAQEPFVIRERGAVHINAFGEPIVAEVGVNQPVTIDKCFGPLIFADLRVTADFQTGDWVIERQRIDSLEWVTVARVTGQHDYEYDEQHPDHREIPE